MDQDYLRAALSGSPSDSMEYGIRRWMAEQGHDPAQVRAVVAVQVADQVDSTTTHTYVMSPTGDDVTTQMLVTHGASAELERQKSNYPWLS